MNWIFTNASFSIVVARNLVLNCFFKKIWVFTDIIWSRCRMILSLFKHEDIMCKNILDIFYFIRWIKKEKKEYFLKSFFKKRDSNFVFRILFRINHDEFFQIFFPGISLKKFQIFFFPHKSLRNLYTIFPHKSLLTLWASKASQNLTWILTEGYDLCQICF